MQIILQTLICNINKISASISICRKKPVSSRCIRIIANRIKGMIGKKKRGINAKELICNTMRLTTPSTYDNSKYVSSLTTAWILLLQVMGDHMVHNIASKPRVVCAENFGHIKGYITVSTISNLSWNTVAVHRQHEGFCKLLHMFK